MSFQIQSSFEPAKGLQLGKWPHEGHEAVQEKRLRIQSYLSQLTNGEPFVSQISPPTESNLMFEVDGVPFRARHLLEGGSFGQLVIWGDLGYLPFSMTAYDKRRNLIAILEHSRRLPHIQFGIDKEMKIVVIGKFDLEHPLTADYLFIPLVRMLGLARPYIKLVGENL